MTALKCSHCGFTGFADHSRCKSCGEALSSPNFQNSSRAMSPEVRKTLKVLAVLTVLGGVIAGAVVVAGKLNAYFDPNPAYIEAISKSPQFKEPVTVRVNQTEIPPISPTTMMGEGRKPGSAVKAADVLEGLGLITMSTETSVETRKSVLTAFSVFGEPSDPKYYDVKNERLTISLTEKGQQEALDWRDTEELYEPYKQYGTFPKLSSTLSWWRIPIGVRQITRIESATEVVENTVEIVFRWRWQPNRLGENFNYGSAAVDALPKKAHNAAIAMGLSSKTEYSARATLKRLGDVWEVVQVNLMNQPAVSE
jgi:hypothetical protein